MKSKNVIIYIVLILFFLVTGYFLGQKGKVSLPGLKLGSFSPDIMYLTQPVNSFSGTIEKIEGNTITVKQPITSGNTLSAVAISPGQMQPTTVPKVLSYKFTVKENTQINKNASFVNYLFKTQATISPPVFTIKNLKIGQQVSIQTNNDLRLNSATIPEANSINIQTTNNMISGKIINITDKAVKILASAQYQASAGINPQTTQPEAKEFQITITDDTEISRYAQMETVTGNNPNSLPQTPKAEKLALSDLKKDMQINVNVAEDIVSSTTKYTALRIEPFAMLNEQPAALPVISSNPLPLVSAPPYIPPAEKTGVNVPEISGANKLPTTPKTDATNL